MPVSTFDPYSMTDKLDEAAIGAMTTRLETRGRHAFFRGMIDDYLDAIEPAKRGRVLEVGCGTGVAARALAQHPGFRGHIDAFDLSGALVEQARTLAEEAGCADRITFSVGDVLELSGGGYDAVIAHTLISHVPDYEACLAAMARAAAPGAPLVVSDGDYASITLGSKDARSGAELANAIIEGLITNPDVMRRMPWLAEAAGLQVSKSFPYLLSEIGSASFFADMFPSLPVLLPKTGVTDEATVQAWVDEQTGYARDGTFFGAINFYTYVLQSKG